MRSGGRRLFVANFAAHATYEVVRLAEHAVGFLRERERGVEHLCLAHRPDHPVAVDADVAAAEDLEPATPGRKFAIARFHRRV